jgi:PPOX class probable F420-dependent enzyme
MANQRADVAMSADEVTAFLTGGRILVMVTFGPDGLPDPVPMWYVVDAEGRIAMRTYAASQKIVNLRRDPRVSGLVEDGERYDELRGVQLTGKMELVDDPEMIADTMVGVLRKYEGLTTDDVPAARTAALARAPKQMGMRLVPERVVSWDHGKLAAR